MSKTTTLSISDLLQLYFVYVLTTEVFFLFGWFLEMFHEIPLTDLRRVKDIPTSYNHFTVCYLYLPKSKGLKTPSLHLSYPIVKRYVRILTSSLLIHKFGTKRGISLGRHTVTCSFTIQPQAAL